MDELEYPRGKSAVVLNLFAQYALPQLKAKVLKKSETLLYIHAQRMNVHSNLRILKDFPVNNTNINLPSYLLEMC